VDETLAPPGALNEKRSRSILDCLDDRFQLTVPEPSVVAEHLPKQLSGAIGNR
jgi:hypothetical protein